MGHVICLTGASGPHGGPRTGAQMAQIAIFKHYLL